MVGHNLLRHRRLIPALVVCLTVALATSVAAVTFLVTATASAALGAGTLNVLGTLQLVSAPAPCTPAAPAEATNCRARTGKGLVSGLGSVVETHDWAYRMGPPTCPSDLGKPLATTGRFVVVGKGEIRFALADGARCVDQEPVRNEPQTFTITGGSGIYEGASGSGTVERAIHLGGSGTERWTGTLIVSGLEFDVTPPTLSGNTSKIVRAPKGARRVPVTYLVNARDDVDGAVSVSCDPRSGTRFPLGRTVVTCSAVDGSGNTQTTRFTITVQRRR